MTTYVSLLRGVNVGGRVIPMADLRKCYQQAGMANVRTVIQSGNVVFESQIDDPIEVQAKLEAAVGQRFGYTARILVLRQSELGPIIEAYPFDASDETYQHYVVFVWPGPPSELAQNPLDPSVEAVQVGSGVVYWRVPKGQTLKSKFGAALGKTKINHTNRNIKTLRKLVD